MIKVAIQGIRGCFHDEVASKLYKEYELVECHDFRDMFKAVENNFADVGIAAIENTLQGSINQTYRLLSRSTLQIIAEYNLDVEQYLIGIEPCDMPRVNATSSKIYSMFPSFAQTELWLDAQVPLADRVEYFDNAASVKKIVDDGLPNQFAIAGKHAAEYYGATVLAGPINDEQQNTTRFFVLGSAEEHFSADADKSSIILTTDHSPGALYNALGVFNAEGINSQAILSPVTSGTICFILILTKMLPVRPA